MTLAVAGTTQYGYGLTKSLRFRSSASAYLNRTPSVAGNRQKFTWSAWLKRGILGSGAKTLFNATNSGSTNNDNIAFYSDAIEVSFSSGSVYFDTTSLYRDVSSWYHIVCAVDTTQATSTNRVLLYVNGVQITAVSGSYPAQNLQTNFNNTFEHDLGRYVSGGYYDGYMAEVNFIDGQQLTPSSFGAFSGIGGVWQPVKYLGTYGTNGFYLPFTNTTSTTTIGYDFSGNGNNWTANNISLTAGATYDSMYDVPTLTSPTVANYCTLNPLYKPNGSSVASTSNGNLSYSASAGGSTGTALIASTMSLKGTKSYWELTWNSNLFFGIVDPNGGYSSANYAGYTACAMYSGGRTISNNSATYSGTNPTFTTNDVIGFAFDGTANTLTVYKNNTSFGTFSSVSSTLEWTPFIAQDTGASTASATINFGQQPWVYSPPTGYVALNTYNLPASTIVQGNKHMDATTYTGTGTTQSVTNAGSFQTDFVWLKCRSNASTSHYLYDTIRGVTNSLTSNDQNAQQTVAQTLTSFNSDGFTLGTAGGSINGNGLTFVGWQWRAGSNTTSSNTSGSVTSTISVNASAGFSICTFNAGSAGNQSFGHGLGAAPQMVIVKDYGTNGSVWAVYHASVTSVNQYIRLEGTSGVTSVTGVWGSGVPTSTVVNYGSNLATFANSTTVAYCWTPIAGFSQFGSYTGNGSTDGPFIYTGFRPKFVMIKRTDASGQDWILWDSARPTYNTTYILYPNTSALEDTSGNIGDLLSNGFKPRSTGLACNANGGTFMYAAFAENPFKNALAR